MIAARFNFQKLLPIVKLKLDLKRGLARIFNMCICFFLAATSPAFAVKRTIVKSINAEEQTDILRKEMHLADDVELLVVPSGMALLTRVEASKLQEVACRYDANHNSSRVEILKKVADAVDKNIIKYNDNLYDALDIRVGIIFLRSDKTLLSIYTQDFGDKADILGQFDSKSIIMTRNFPIEIRKIISSFGMKSSDKKLDCL